MPNSLIGWIGFSSMLTLFSAILFIVVGCIMYSMPAMQRRAQTLMRIGAGIGVGFIIVGGILGAIIGRAGVDWENIGFILIYAAVGFGLPWLWKRFYRRN